MEKKLGALLLTVLMLCMVWCAALAADVRVTKASDIPTCDEYVCWDWRTKPDGEEYICKEHFPDKAYTLTLDADVTINRFDIPENASVTLELNGHTLTITPVGIGTDEEGGGFISNMGKLTVKDSKGGGKLISTHSFLISNYGYVTVEGGTLTTKPGYTLIYNSGNLAVKGGLLLNDNASSEWLVVDHGDEPDCPGPQGDRKFTMTGGEIRQASKKAPAVLASCFGDGASITGGVINSASEAVRAWGPVKVAGEAKITGDIKVQIHPLHGFDEAMLTVQGNARIEGDVMYVHNVYPREEVKPSRYEPPRGSEIVFKGGMLKGKLYEGTLTHVATYYEDWDEYMLDTPWDQPIREGAPKTAGRVIEFFVRSAIADSNAPIKVEAGKFTEPVAVAYLAPQVEHKATLNAKNEDAKTEMVAYYGASEKEVAKTIAEDAKAGDEIIVVTGSMDLTAVDEGVVLTKAPEAEKVTVNGVTVQEKAVVLANGVEEVLTEDSVDLPKTGDESRIGLWMAMLSLCFAGMALVRKARRA